MSKIVKLEVFRPEERMPEVSGFRDHSGNLSRYPFLVYHEKTVKWAVMDDFVDGSVSFRYVGNKKKIKNVQYWVELPRAEDLTMAL